MDSLLKAFLLKVGGGEENRGVSHTAQSAAKPPPTHSISMQSSERIGLFIYFAWGALWGLGVICVWEVVSAASL